MSYRFALLLGASACVACATFSASPDSGGSDAGSADSADAVAPPDSATDGAPQDGAPILSTGPDSGCALPPLAFSDTFASAAFGPGWMTQQTNGSVGIVASTIGSLPNALHAMTSLPQGEPSDGQANVLATLALSSAMPPRTIDVAYVVQLVPNATFAEVGCGVLLLDSKATVLGSTLFTLGEDSNGALTFRVGNLMGATRTASTAVSFVPSLTQGTGATTYDAALHLDIDDMGVAKGTLTLSSRAPGGPLVLGMATLDAFQAVASPDRLQLACGIVSSEGNGLAAVLVDDVSLTACPR